MAGRPRRDAALAAEASSAGSASDRIVDDAVAPMVGPTERVTVADPAGDFAGAVVAWQRQHGRQTLPWQQLGGTRDAYRVWLAEIMLQQTQVAAVVPFYRRFVDRFPDVRALAAASLDDVMQHWSGLGYYSRARNLHATARRVVDAYEGVFPDTVDALEALPGIGRSTAGAIAAFAYGRKAPILDGNVKRVLMRVHAIDGTAGDAAVLRRLWTIADAALPDRDIERYTQGMMDIGATLCTPRRPACLLCPLERRCLAHRAGREEAYPRRARRKPLPERRSTLLLVTRNDEVLLERRPATGVWGGLWSLPEWRDDTAVPGADERAKRVDEGRGHEGGGDEGGGDEGGGDGGAEERGEEGASSAAGRAALEVALAAHGSPLAIERVPGFVHGFTHFVLQADVMRVRLGPPPVPAIAAEPAATTRWIALDALQTVGLPAPVRTLLARCATEAHD